MIQEDDTCMRCGKHLDHNKSVWLELSFKTGLFAENVAPDESQGSFEFGANCVRAILGNSGKMVRVGRAARLNPGT